MPKQKKLRYDYTADYDFDGLTPEQAIAMINRREAELLESFPDGEIRLSHQQKEYSEGYELAWRVYTLETDQEEQERMLQEEEFKRRRDERDRQEFERLTEKFKK